MELILIIIATSLTTLVFREVYAIRRDADKSNDYPLTIVFMTTLAVLFMVLGALTGVTIPEPAWKMAGYTVIVNGVILSMRYLGRDAASSIIEKYIDKK